MTRTDKGYTRDQVWKAIKSVFNPTARAYELDGQLLPVTNSEDDEKQIKRVFFTTLDDIANKRKQKELSIELHYEDRGRPAST